MRILHTGDWHMMEKLGRQDRADDIRCRLREINEILLSRDVEVMVVAGDVFRENLSREMFEQCVRDIGEIFGAFLKKEGTILAIPGNHDQPAYFNAVALALKLAPGSGKGRVHFAPRPEVVTLYDRANFPVQFMLLPYPHDAYMTGEWKTAGQQNSSREDNYKAIVDALTQYHLDKTKKTVLVGHVHIRGIGVGRHGYKITEEQDVLVNASDVALTWAYSAFGHIHKPQEIVPGTPTARYCGSVERLDMGEKDDEKEVVLVDILPGAEAARVERIPLPNATRLREILVDMTQGDGVIKGLEPDATSLVKARIRYRAGIDNVTQALRELRKIYPRLYAVDEERLKGDGAPPPPIRPLDDVSGNVDTYLRETLPNETQRDALWKLFQQLMTQMNG